MIVDAFTPILNVTDISASFAWFEKLGWQKRWDYGDPPDFGAVGNAGCEIFLCQDCQGGRESPNANRVEGWQSGGSWMSWWVGSPMEVDAAYELATKHGIEVTCKPADMEWGVRECHLRHPDGHVFRVSAGLHGDIDVPSHVREKEPPLPIERVVMTVRLEKRIVALLRDLAAHKGMDLTSCLEETFLHTFERLGSGVASPHTTATLRHIQELKAKHGIDYDTHASYRFVEP
jgi:catechol 2,3-dioxygenase-like lactoylglutathione lyase family enzyme